MYVFTVYIVLIMYVSLFTWPARKARMTFRPARQEEKSAYKGLREMESRRFTSLPY